jgi:hypothetical protein
VTEDEDTPLQRPRLERVGLVGATSADRIRASGHACRIKQAGHMAAPDRYNVKSEITSCEVGVVHTWSLRSPARSQASAAAQVGWIMRPCSQNISNGPQTMKNMMNSAPVMGRCPA